MRALPSTNINNSSHFHEKIRMKFASEVIGLESMQSFQRKQTARLIGCQLSATFFKKYTRKSKSVATNAILLHPAEKKFIYELPTLSKTLSKIEFQFEMKCVESILI